MHFERRRTRMAISLYAFSSTNYVQRASRHAEEFGEGASSGRMSFKSSFVYCREDHPHVQCSKVRETKKRLKIVQKNNLCSNCLIPNHKAAQCVSKGRCYMSQNKKHHFSKHDEQFEQKRSTAPVQPRVQPAPVFLQFFRKEFKMWHESFFIRMGNYL